MIVTIKGILTHKMPDEIIIDINGLGYACYISTNTYDNLPKLREEVSLLTYFHVTENSQQLFAFADVTERELFMMLIGVSGIGPKTAARIVLELKDKLDKFVGFQSEETTSDDVDIFSAMQGLGYSDREIRIAIRDTKFEDNLSFEDKIKTLLQKIAEVS